MIKKFIVTIILILSILFSGLNLTMVEANEDTNSEITILNLNDIDFKDFSNWKSGLYHWTNGEYCEFDTRICLNDYVKVTGGEYKVIVKNSDYRLLVRELDENKEFIETYMLSDGQTYKPSGNSYYLGISIYNAKSEKGITYNTYKQLFSNGFYAGLEKIKEDDENVLSDNKEITILDSMYSTTKNFTFTNSDIKITNETIVTLEGTINTVTYGDIFNAASGKYVFRMENTNGIYRRMSWWNDKVSNVKANAKLVIKQNGRYTTVSLNDETKKSSMSTDIPFTGTGFKLNMSMISLKELKIEDKNGVLIKDYVPALDKEGKPCIYDKVNNSCQYFKDTSSLVYDKPEIKVIDFKDIDFKDFSNWRSGLYHWSNGEYCEYDTRICLNDYVKVTGGEYKVIVKNSDYRLLIRELDKDKKFIETYTISNGQTYKPSNNTCYLAISIYNAKSENGITYNTYKQLFAKGFYAGLEEVEENEDKVQDDITIDSSNNNSTSSNSKPATFRDELKQMILTGDMTKHDISKYGLTYRQVDDTWNDLKQNECYVAVRTYGAAFLSTTRNSAGIVQTVYIYNADADFVNRYNRTCAAIDEFMAGTDSKMTDLDKILYAHEYIVKNTTYSKDTGNIGGCAGGILGDRKGYCQGYANAVILLLHKMNIDSCLVSSKSMNHGWLIVELDGQYYHMDPTWDNTQPGPNNMYYHRFLLRNDKEFTTIKGARAHYGWYCSSKPGFTSTSTRFTNWFVHDVAGTMYYYDGMWYYQDISSNSIICSDVNGNNKTVVVDGNTVSGAVRLSGITSGVLKYTVGGNSYTKKLK